MENNNPDFMKNRPPVAFANQAQDVFGSQQRSTRTVVTAILIILMLIMIVVSLIKGNYMIPAICGPILVILIVSIILSLRADKKNAAAEPQDHPEALFKDHEI